DEHGGLHPGKTDIDAESRRAFDLRLCIEADPRSSDNAVVLGALERGHLRHERGRTRSTRSIAQLLSGRRMNDLAVDGAALFEGYVPGLRRRLAEPFASRRARRPERIPRGLHARASTGELEAERGVVVLSIRGCEANLHLLRRDLQLLGHNHRVRGHDALT